MDCLKRQPGSRTQAKKDDYTIYSPLKGKILPLQSIGDGIFSEEILGKGCGIEPDGDTVFSPFDGTISQIAETAHAIGLTSTSGIELLVHIGLDTVEMGGKGFAIKVSVGQRLNKGEPLLSFDKAAIDEAGHPSVVVVVVTNSNKYTYINLLENNIVVPGVPLFEIIT